MQRPVWLTVPRKADMSTYRIMITTLVVGLAASSVDARVKCAADSRCDRTEIVAGVRAAIEQACPCTAQPNKKAYRRCAKQELKRRQQELGKADFPKPCRKEVVRAFKNATCGRPGTVVCNKTNKKGRTRCSVTDADRCPAEPGRSSPCGAFTSCVDACVPDGGCPSTPPTTLPPPTSTTTTTKTTTTTTTIVSGTSTSLLTSSTVVVTTTSTVPTTTMTTIPTTLPCADVNLGSGAPLVVSGTTAGAGDDDLAPLACLEFPMPGGEDVLYEWTAPASGTFVFDTRATALDTVIYVRDACGGTVLGCNDDPFGLGGPDGVSARAAAALTSGQTVLVVVDSANLSGAFSLKITGPFAADSCCVIHGTAGCSPGATEACVCALDDLCCSAEWDDVCVWRAITNCSAVCG